TFPAARLEITGSVPQGAGLSSSAALEVALCLALLGLGGEDEPDRVALAQLCSRIEREWVGAHTGLLDQLASLLGEPGHALRIDFRSLEVVAVPLELGDWTLVTADSGEAHSIAASGYNARRAECAEAARRLRGASLRDIDARAAGDLPSPPDRRALRGGAGARIRELDAYLGRQPCLPSRADAPAGDARRAAPDRRGRAADSGAGHAALVQRHRGLGGTRGARGAARGRGRGSRGR